MTHIVWDMSDSDYLPKRYVVKRTTSSGKHGFLRSVDDGGIRIKAGSRETAEVYQSLGEAKEAAVQHGETFGFAEYAYEYIEVE